MVGFLGINGDNQARLRILRHERARPVADFILGGEGKLVDCIQEQQRAFALQTAFQVRRNLRGRERGGVLLDGRRERNQRIFGGIGKGKIMGVDVEQ